MISRNSLNKSKSHSTSFGDISQEIAEEQADGGVSFDVWNRYFRAGGSIFLLLLLLFVLIASQVVISGSDYFVNYWTQQEFLRVNNKTTILTTNECLMFYGIFIIGVIIVSVNKKKLQIFY